jgi:hypothetical protein
MESGFKSHPRLQIFRLALAQLTSIRHVTARSGSDDFRRLRDGIAQFILCFQPIFDIVTVFFAALHVELMSSTSN